MSTPQWTNRVWSEFRADNLTRGYRDVLLTLRTFRGVGGLCMPSHATLANRAKCSVRTVQRALQQAQHLGLLLWAERRVRCSWRWLRTSNVYRFLVPDDRVKTGQRVAFVRPSTTGQSGGGGESLSKKEALQALLQTAAQLPDLLARRRATIEQRLLEETRNRQHA